MEESRYDLAIEELKKSLKGHSDFIPALRTLAEAYQMNGQDEKSLPVLEKVLRLDNGDRAAMYLLGLTYESMGQEDKALALFEKLSHLQPVRDDVFYHLGLIYGREKKLGLAHYNFGVYFMLTGEMNKARFHFQKAKETAKGDPALMKKIEKETKGLREELS
jgi:tetratricopeptide (TPR) repeat protein